MHYCPNNALCIIQNDYTNTKHDIILHKMIFSLMNLHPSQYLCLNWVCACLNQLNLSYTNSIKVGI